MEISESLAAALDDVVVTSAAAELSPMDRQAIRRAVEAAQMLVNVARQEGFGAVSE